VGGERGGRRRTGSFAVWRPGMVSEKESAEDEFLYPPGRPGSEEQRSLQRAELVLSPAGRGKRRHNEREKEPGKKRNTHVR